MFIITLFFIICIDICYPGHVITNKMVAKGYLIIFLGDLTQSVTSGINFDITSKILLGGSRTAGRKSILQPETYKNHVAMIYHNLINTYVTNI